MTLEQLLEMGLSEEQAKAVLAGLDGNFVTKARFNEVNGEKKRLEGENKTLQTELETAQGDLETLRGAAGNDEAQKTITALQGENAALKAAAETAETTHAAALQALKVDHALEKALAGARARNTTAVKALLKLDDVELDEDGNLKGLDEQLKGLAEGKDTAFLFEAAKQEPASKLAGFVPGERRDGPPTPPQPTSLREAVSMALDAPAQGKEG